MEFCYVAYAEVFEDLESVLEYISDEESFDEVDSVEVFKRKKVKPTHANFIDVEGMLDNMRENAYCDNEFADDYLDVVYNKEKMKELKLVVLNWLNENAEQPCFYEAGEIVETIAVTPDYIENFWKV